MTKIAIIDYGMGNLYSVRNSLLALKASADILDSPKLLMSYGKVILPGVGAFGDAMRELSKRGLVDPLKEFAMQGRPFLGICLGMQLLLDKSQESKAMKGLGLIPGECRKFSGKLKVPHMGWNKISIKDRSSALFKKLPSEIYAYFCHSYYVVPKNRQTTQGETEYGVKFASIIGKGNIFGMQFHPEKSQETGLSLLRNFIEIC